MSKLRIGVVLESQKVPDWKIVLLKKIEEDNSAKILSLLLTEDHKKERVYSLWKRHIRLDEWYFKPSPDAFKEINFAQAFKNIPIINWENKQQLKTQNLDIILWLNDDPIDAEFYDMALLGVFYFSNGEERNTSEQFLGYREFINLKEVITSSLMVRTKADKMERQIYQTWSMMPTFSISRARNGHAWKLSALIPRALKELSEKGSEAFFRNTKKLENSSTSSQLEEKAKVSFLDSLVNMQKHFCRMCYKLKKKIGYKEQWILMLNRNQGASTNFSAFEKLLPPKDRFWADPFLIEKDKKQFIFFEELPFATDKGHLSVMEINKFGGVSEAVTILEKPYHLSYPFIFEEKGKHYMIPESFEDKSIQMYECTGFPYHWEHKMNLMTGVNAFDTTLYFYNEKWWMFTVMSHHEGCGHNDELFLFFAETPFTTEWTSHPQNPIVTDVRLARPAGKIYEENGQLIRPSQDCARKYGYGFNLNEIEVLTETEYREKRILNVRPYWDKAISRTHSFNHLQGVTVIDATIQRSRFF